MKKKITIMISICLLPFFLWGILFIIDITRFGEKAPLITIKKNVYSYIDGDDTQYCSLGYEFLHQNRARNKGWYFNFGCSKIEVEQVKQMNFIYEGEVYEECHDDYLYETADKTYYLRCVDADGLYIMIDGEKILVTKALQDGKITIQDFNNSVYTIFVQPKN